MKPNQNTHTLNIELLIFSHCLKFAIFKKKLGMKPHQKKKKDTASPTLVSHHDKANDQISL
jgi:hypothetical protein